MSFKRDTIPTYIVIQECKLLEIILCIETTSLPYVYGSKKNVPAKVGAEADVPATEFVKPLTMTWKFSP